MRAYELMIILDNETDDRVADQVVEQVADYVSSLGGQVANEDRWGMRRFAYEINHKSEGFYTVLEFVTPGGELAPLERNLRLADEVVRHKLIRLPEKEAARRGLLGEPQPAAEDSASAPDAAGDEPPAIGDSRPMGAPPAVGDSRPAQGVPAEGAAPEIGASRPAASPLAD